MQQRIVVVGAAFATLALIGALVYYGSRSDYSVLFSDLKPADAQTVVEKIKAANVPYELSAGGTTVSVPAERIPELRLQIAASGALSGGHVGFDLFDKNSFGATDFTQQVNYQRAIEGELARTLEGTDEVESARVHITRPRESLFADKAERAKASVVLRTRQGHELSRERTQAVVSLIASAVEGLDPADVSVMDARGRLLSAPDRAGASEAGAFGTHLESRRKFESETAERIVTLLEPVVGAGHVRSDVAADVDFSQVEQTEEKYDPKSAVIRSQQTSQEARNAAQNGAGGISGARANDPTAQTVPAPAANQPAANGDQRATSMTNYEIDKTVRRTVSGGGKVSRLSASVVLDYKNVNGVATARTPDELQKMQELVSAAIGLDTQRGDQIAVQTIPFDQPVVETTAQTWMDKNRELVRSIVRYGFLTLATLLLLIFVVRPARRALRAASAPNAMPHLLPASTTVSEALAFNQASNALSESTGSPRTVAEIEAEMEAQMDSEVARETAAMAPKVTRSKALKKQILERGEQEPETIAMTLRGWLQES